MSVGISDVFGAWRYDLTAACAVVLCLTYLAKVRRTAKAAVPTVRRVVFVLGCVLWVLAVTSSVGVFAPHLFWVRALQIVVLLYGVPLLLASGMPLTVFGVTPRGPAIRIMTHPAITSAVLLLTPWVLIFSGWNVAAMQNPWLGLLTTLWLVAAGFGYFYSRLQVDPVPRRYPQWLSLLITMVESVADGVLGIVVWLGPTLYPLYYARFGHSPEQLQLSQTIGAGMLWILADVISLPFLGLLMVALRSDDVRRARNNDKRFETAAAQQDSPTGLWWENDPQMAERFKRH